ncbi:MAG: alpha/beta fold hydrolase [Gammaproteobacteria bacterium]|nr:alpha/beta fold hydrolase [Gammaproteobacteria bacterium]
MQAYFVVRPSKWLGCLCIALSGIAAADTVQRTTVNDGNLVMEDVPTITAEIVTALNRYQNVRSAGFRGWTEDGNGIYISTRFGDVSQLHRVDMPGGARHQITFYDEPIGAVTRQPSGSNLSFTRDVGGSEFTQIFMLDPATGNARMLTDGESRNGAVVWDRQGRRIAFRSTRRNGASNDLWIMDATESGDGELILESPDGTSWSPAEFSASGSKLLLSNYVSIADSRVHLLDLDSGEAQLLAGGTTKRSANSPVAFDDANDGFWFITDQAGEFRTLAWQALDSAASPVFVTADIPWDVEDAAISHDRSRMAFNINENGRSRVYLLDTATRQYASVDILPVGLAYNLTFSPDDRSLAMSLSTATSPSDTFVLELGEKPLEFRRLVRWTTSEVGGLDTSTFRSPELVQYPTFDTAGDGPRMIPAWVYTPPGDGPFPVIVVIHGGPEGQSRPGFSSTYQMWLQQLGAAVIRPNVRGSAGYGKSYLALDNGFGREDSVRDIGALLDWIGTQPQFDHDRIAVIGGSYGGYMALACAVHYGDRLKAVVDIVGISSFVTFLENTQDYRRDLRRVEYGDERDPAMRAHLEKISPLNNVDKMTVPMFVVQGQNDPRVPVTEAEQIVAALRDQGRQVWYMNALNEGHGYRKKENRDIYEQATMMFFGKYLSAE